MKSKILHETNDSFVYIYIPRTQMTTALISEKALFWGVFLQKIEVIWGTAPPPAPPLAPLGRDQRDSSDPEPRSVDLWGKTPMVKRTKIRGHKSKK